MSYRHGTSNDTERMPGWMRRPLSTPGRAAEVEGLLDSLDLRTVCRSARCPNRGECYASGTATFLVLGDRCTRDCRFCAVESAPPLPPDEDEPRRVAQAAVRMRLRHAVVTMVTRDDLADGGAAHLAAVIAALRREAPASTVEVLVSDFGGDTDAVDVVVAAEPDVFNHNVETVPRLYRQVRPGASYDRSLRVLAHGESAATGTPTKSGLMVGLGETHDEVVSVLADLRDAGVDIVTIGQYLRPGPRHLPVSRFVEPDEFDDYARIAAGLGFSAVSSAPFVRSSYHAAESVEAARRAD